MKTSYCGLLPCFILSISILILILFLLSFGLGYFDNYHHYHNSFFVLSLLGKAVTSHFYIYIYSIDFKQTSLNSL